MRRSFDDYFEPLEISEGDEVTEEEIEEIKLAENLKLKKSEDGSTIYLLEDGEIIYKFVFQTVGDLGKFYVCTQSPN